MEKKLPKIDSSVQVRRNQARNIYFEKALREEQKGDFRKALEFYRMSLQLDTQFFDSWLNAGAIYSRQGKTKKAIECYQRALSSRIDKRVCYNLASEYFKIGSYEESKKLLNSAIKSDHRFLQAHLLLGYVFGKLGENEKSEISIKNALKIDPTNQPAMTALALLYYHTSRPELALRYINILLQRNPGDVTIGRLLANIELDRGSTRASIKALKEIAAQDPKLKSFYSSISESIPEKQLSDIRSQKNQKENIKNKTAKDFFDLSLLAMFDGEPDKAMEYLLAASGDARH
ncbi:MAG: tetratricopeptide repeat protein [Leptospiraceae bacterium]|nr:tetratricopeptide repeat protein [Leptospiraceae bacterium]